jgi:peroxiredoxin family protein
MDSPDKKPLCILLLSGYLDRLVAAVNLAASAQALGRDVNLFMTWDPLLRLARNTMDEAPLSASLGEAVEIAKNVLAKHASVSELFSELRATGLKIYACSNTMQVLGISEEDLEGKVDGISGATAFLAMSEHAQIISL